jgi:hypothetical protein
LGGLLGLAGGSFSGSFGDGFGFGGVFDYDFFFFGRGGEFVAGDGAVATDDV